MFVILLLLFSSSENSSYKFSSSISSFTNLSYSFISNFLSSAKILILLFLFIREASEATIFKIKKIFYLHSNVVPDEIFDNSLFFSLLSKLIL